MLRWDVEDFLFVKVWNSVNIQYVCVCVCPIALYFLQRTSSNVLTRYSLSRALIRVELRCSQCSIYFRFGGRTLGPNPKNNYIALAAYYNVRTVVSQFISSFHMARVLQLQLLCLLWKCLTVFVCLYVTGSHRLTLSA